MQDTARREKTKIFMNGRSQAVRIPARYRFATDEVYIWQDAETGDLILSKAPMSMAEILAAFDECGVPENFLSEKERDLSPAPLRPDL